MAARPLEELIPSAIADGASTTDAVLKWLEDHGYKFDDIRDRVAAELERLR